MVDQSKGPHQHRKETVVKTEPPIITTPPLPEQDDKRQLIKTEKKDDGYPDVGLSRMQTTSESPKHSRNLTSANGSVVEQDKHMKMLKQVKTLERTLMKHCKQRLETSNQDGNETQSVASTSRHRSGEYKTGACGSSERNMHGSKERDEPDEQRHNPYGRGGGKRSDRRINGIGSERTGGLSKHGAKSRNRSRSPVIDNNPSADVIKIEPTRITTDITNAQEITNGPTMSTTATCAGSSNLQTLQNNEMSGNTKTNNPELQMLGEKFASWFYESLNSHNPTYRKNVQDFGPEHFWDDCYLLIASETRSQGIEQDKFATPFVVSQRFLAFTRDEHVLFNPNVSAEGVFVSKDPHGLVMILVCGTVHQNNDCLGTFQQTFGIVKDPRYENNWKIKMSILKVKTTQVTAMPKLQENPDHQMRALMAP